MNHIFILVISSLIAMNCCIVGTFLVLRNMAMMSDALAHIILPGIATIFLVTGSKSPFYMLIGASAVGLLAAFLIEYNQKTIRLQSDAAIGIVFTFFFAIGIVIISAFSRKVDLDPDCVIYGEIAYAPLDIWITRSGVNMGPRSIYILSVVLVVNIIFVAVAYKELKVTTFDPMFSSTIGINTTLFHYLLVAAASITTISAFETAGIVLNVSFVVVPAATAYVFTTSLSKMLILSVIFGIVACIVGYALSVAINASISGAIATTSGFILGITIFVKRFQNRAQVT